MEVVFRQVPCFPCSNGGGGGADASQSRHLSRSFCCPKQKSSNRKSVIGLADFSDKSHLQYYDDSSRMEEKEMKKKKQLKVVKGLSKNLSSFYDMGFGLNLDNNNNNGLDEQVRGKMMISEATEVLVSQLQKLKAEKMELKRMKKQDKKKKAAAKMMKNYKCKEESSSSSSSSESECEKVRSNVIGETTTTSSLSLVGEAQVEKSIDSSNRMMMMLSDCTRSNKMIEVCMGGKCKKSGGAVLLENFEKAVVVGNVQVVGCKCMGKCRDGPNVRLVNSNNNPTLCMAMGVGLGDVDSIVNQYLFPSPAPAL